MAEYDVQKITLLPVAGTITDNDMILIIQGGKAKRALPSAMKGKKGDPGLGVFLGITETHIVWKQGANGSWNNLFEIERLRGPRGEKPIFRKVDGTLMMKYEGEPDTMWVNIFDREELKMKFSDLTPAEVNLLKLHFSDLTVTDKAELMKPATDAAAASKKQDEAIRLTEGARVLAEKSRVDTEQARVLTEQSRVKTEEARILAERARVAEEQKRTDMEELRDQAEQARILAEQLRAEAESARVLAEQSRVKAEEARILAERAREVAERLRSEAETVRIIQEQKRTEVEILRNQSEIKRDEAEILRNRDEAARATNEIDRDTTEQERITKETERIRAEVLRISKENTRIETEGARIVEEQLRKVAEQKRKDTEAGRVIAEELRETNTVQAILDTEDATQKAKAATAITLDLNAHPMKIMGGIWFEWNVADQEYRNTGIQAKGDVGSSFKIVGRYDTLDELKVAVPDGTNVDGVYAIGAVEPFSYYAWLVVDGVWQWDDQGKLRGAEGKSSFEVWREYPENAGKTEDEYFDWLSPIIDPETGRWKVQGEDKGVQALGIDAEVTEKDNTEDSYILHVKSAKGEFDTPNIRGISVKVTEKENTPDTYILTFKHAQGEFTTPNLRGFDVKVEENAGNTPDDYKLDITTVTGKITTPNLQGRSGSSVIDIDHEPTAADTHYTYNGTQYPFNAGNEVRYKDEEAGEFIFFKCYDISAAGAVWEEIGSGGALPFNVYLSPATDYDNLTPDVKWINDNLLNN